MAEKTKADLEKEIADLKAAAAESPYSSDANYQKEFERLNTKARKAESELEALKKKTRDEKIERENQANDKKAAEDARKAEFGTSKLSQDEHTRFRAYPKAPAGERDIWGDPTSEVFDLGVNLANYSGGLYVPVENVIEMARSIGMLTTDQANDLQLELDSTKAQVESSGRFAKDLLDGITSHVDDFYRNLSNVGSDDVSAVSDSGNSGSGNGEIAGQASDADKREESDGIPSGSNDSKSKSDGSGTPSLFGSLS